MNIGLGANKTSIEAEPCSGKTALLSLEVTRKVWEQRPWTDTEPCREAGGATLCGDIALHLPAAGSGAGGAGVVVVAGS